MYIYVYTYTYIHICMLHMPGNMYADVRHISQTGPPCGSDVGTWFCMAPCMKLMLCSSTRFLIEFSCRGTNMFCSTPIHASMNCCCHHRVKHASTLRLPTQQTCCLHDVRIPTVFLRVCACAEHLAQERVDKDRLKCIWYTNQD
jgi:hypothetical protein